MRIRILSFGGGVQTTALALMWGEGALEADYCVFADTGGETPETYAHIEAVERRIGRPIHRVAFRGDTLEVYTLTRSTPIPIFTAGGLGQRQCTNKWKVEPVKRFARSQGATELRLVLGISIDEVHRVKPDRERWVTREYPLVDLRMTRADCLAMAAEAGFASVPKSACFYCPFQGGGRWARLAVEHPDLFARAQEMERAVNARRSAKGQGAAFLSSTKRPLATTAVGGAMLDGFGNDCEGVCGV